MDHPGEVTKGWRKARKMSIETLADLTGIDKGTISRFENRGNFTMRVFRLICEAFGKTLGDAYAEMATPQPASIQPRIEISKEHIPVHAALEEILNAADKRLAMWITGNVYTFRQYSRSFPLRTPERNDDIIIGADLVDWGEGPGLNFDLVTDNINLVPTKLERRRKKSR